MVRLPKFRGPWSPKDKPQRELTTMECEALILAVLADGNPRNVFWIKKDAESTIGQPLSGSSINLVLARLEDEGKVTSSFGQASGAGIGRLYRRK
jgi:DNA-binding PadR family transcriptional regulator